MGKIEIRPITEGEDLLRYWKLCSNLYRSTNRHLEDEDAFRKSSVEDRKALPAEDVLLGAYEDGVLYSGLRLRPYTVQFEGRELGMSGIGGVISDPAAAGKGAVKALFTEGFRIMREQGRPVSHLYPFDTWYYRQFGYEAAASSTEWSIPMTHFRPAGIGRFLPFDNSPEMKRQVREVYSAFSVRYNLCVVKTEKDWERFFEEHAAYTSGWFSYLHETDGRADAFLSFRAQDYPDKASDLRAPCVWFSSLLGLREIFAYFKTQIPYADRAVLTLPQDVDLSAAIGLSDGWGKRNTRVSGGFVGLSRAVDVQALLAAARIRGGAKGEVTIRIAGDKYCPWNNGVYTVPLEVPAQTVKAEDRGQPADIEMTPNAFVSLFFARYGVDACELLPGVTLNGNREKLSALFYPKPCFIDVRF